MIASMSLAVVGLVLLTLAADHLVLGASRLAARLRVRPVVVGVVVIGLGTSAPEFLVSGVAAARGDMGLAVGNIAGSNIINVTLILGVAAMVSSFAVASAVVRREVRLAVTAVAVFGALAWAGLSVWSGIGLALLGLAALGLLLRWAAEGRNSELAVEVVDFAADGRRGVWLEPSRAVLGLAGVLVGAQLLVANSSVVAQRLGVSQVVIGFTVVALGTSLPELVTTVQAMRRNESDLVVGNLFGSNLFNSLVGGAVIAFAAPHGRAPSLSVVLVVTMIFTVVLARALLRRGLVLARGEAVVLLLVYLLTMPLLVVG